MKVRREFESRPRRTLRATVRPVRGRGWVAEVFGPGGDLMCASAQRFEDDAVSLVRQVMASQGLRCREVVLADE